MDFNAAEPSNRGSANTSPDPLNSLQGVVDAAKEAAQITTTPPTVTPQEQFKNQFGPGLATPSVTETTVLTDTPVASLDPNSTVEAAAPAEQTPADKLKKQIADSVDAFLAEVTKEKVAV